MLETTIERLGKDGISERGKETQRSIEYNVHGRIRGNGYMGARCRSF